VELRRKRRRIYAGAALIGVVAAAVAIPVFALGQGGSGGSTVVSGNAVAIIDPGSNKVTAQVPVGVAPTALAVGAGGLWVANSSDKTVTPIDLASGKFVGNVPLAGDVPLGVAAASNAVWMVGQ
jgi:virginiamycin B lyase